MATLTNLRLSAIKMLTPKNEIDKLTEENQELGRQLDAIRERRKVILQRLRELERIRYMEANGITTAN